MARGARRSGAPEAPRFGPLRFSTGTLLRSARRRLDLPRRALGHGSRAALLAIAKRLRVPQSKRPAEPPRRAWPSGRLSFDEFLVQWPCEIELAAELDDAAFVDEAYRLILLRGPAVAEREQCLRLL